jgi:hypothetical protein
MQRIAPLRPSLELRRGVAVSDFPRRGQRVDLPAAWCAAPPHPAAVAELPRQVQCVKVPHRPRWMDLHRHGASMATLPDARGGAPPMRTARGAAPRPGVDLHRRDASVGALPRRSSVSLGFAASAGVAVATSHTPVSHIGWRRRRR